MAARKPSAHSANYVRLSEAHRGKIQNSSILNALIEHAEGRREMTSTQVTAALGLMKKCLPDLQSVQLSGTDADGNPSEILIRVIKPDR
jgi:hypothetical protein